MHKRLLGLGLFSLGLGLALSPTAARADFQQIYQADIPQNQAATNQNLNISATDTNFGPGTANLINDPFQIQQFDATKYHMVVNGIDRQATLYEVVVSLKYEFQNTIQMSFVNPSTSTVTAQGVMRLDVNNTLGKLALANVVNTPTFFTQKTLTFPTDIKNASYIQPTPKVVASTSAMGYFDKSTLDLFSGKGTLSLPVYATATSGYTNSAGNGAGGSRTSAAAALSVTYYYYFVPEPSSLALTGLGALGLCVVCRARNRREENAAA